MNQQPNIPVVILLLAMMAMVAEAAIQKERSLTLALIRALGLR